MVSVDIYVNETTRHADVVLPPPSALQKPHYDLALLQLALRNVANWSEPVLPLDDGQPDEWEILARLALIASGSMPRPTRPHSTRPRCGRRWPRSCPTTCARPSSRPGAPARLATSTPSSAAGPTV